MRQSVSHLQYLCDEYLIVLPSTLIDRQRELSWASKSAGAFTNFLIFPLRHIWVSCLPIEKTQTKFAQWNNVGALSICEKEITAYIAHERRMQVCRWENWVKSCIECQINLREKQQQKLDFYNDSRSHYNSTYNLSPCHGIRAFSEPYANTSNLHSN